MMRGDDAGSDAASWLLLAMLVILLAVLHPLTSFRVTPASFGTVLTTCALLGGASLFYRHIRRRHNFAIMFTALPQVLLFSAMGSVLSYQVAGFGGALWDTRFAAWDAALGFDWLGFVRWVDGQALLVPVLRLAYASLVPQIIALVLILGFTGRLLPLRIVIFAAMLCGVITVLLSPLFPAYSNYVHLGLTGGDFARLDPWAGYVHMQHLTALRGGEPLLLNLHTMQGIITFPSYHSGLAAVTLWGFLQIEQRWLGWPLALVSMLTIVATPVDGGHYLVDVIAGGVLAMFSVAVAKRAVRWCPQRPSHGGAPRGAVMPA